MFFKDAHANLDKIRIYWAECSVKTTNLCDKFSLVRTTENLLNAESEHNLPHHQRKENKNVIFSKCRKRNLEILIILN